MLWASFKYVEIKNKKNFRKTKTGALGPGFRQRNA